jgi:hypothetical protein
MGTEVLNLLDAFRKKCEKRLLASSCLSVRLSAWNKPARTGRIFVKFHIFAFFYFSIIYREASNFIKIPQEQRALYTKIFSHLWQYLAEFFLEWKIFQIKFAEKIKRHILYSETFSRKSCRLWVNIKTFGGAREAADDNIAARCMMDKSGYTRASTRAYKHTHKYVILLSYGKFFSRMRINIALHAHWLLCVLFSCVHGTRSPVYADWLWCSRIFTWVTVVFLQR